MKFDTRAIQILRNFANINQSMIFKSGNELKTISIGPNRNRSVIGKATISTEIEGSFAIYNLGEFLGALSMFDNPELTPTDHYMIIGDSKESIKYTFCEPSLLMSVPEKQIKLPSIDVTFTLKNEVLTRLLKGVGIVAAPEISITGDGTHIYIEAINSKDSSKSNYSVQIGETTKNFRFIFLAENMKVLPGDYEVDLCAKGITHFKGSDVEYWIAMESNSSYND